MEGMSAQAIDDNLVATLGAEASAYSTVMKYLGTAQFDPAKDPLNSDASSSHLDDSDKAILAALEEKSFSSVRELARATHLPRITVHRRLTNSLWFILYRLRWVPCMPFGPQKVQVQRVELSPSLLRMFGL
jgi:hypothetical protein